MLFWLLLYLKRTFLSEMHPKLSLSIDDLQLFFWNIPHHSVVWTYSFLLKQPYLLFRQHIINKTIYLLHLPQFLSVFPYRFLEGFNLGRCFESPHFWQKWLLASSQTLYFSLFLFDFRLDLLHLFLVCSPTVYNFLEGQNLSFLSLDLLKESL